MIKNKTEYNILEGAKLFAASNKIKYDEVYQEMIINAIREFEYRRNPLRRLYDLFNVDVSGWNTGQIWFGENYRGVYLFALIIITLGYCCA